MKKPEGYDEAQVINGEYEKLEAGGYICKIINAKEEESKNGNKMLVIAFDIVEGEHKDFYQRRYEQAKKANNDPNNLVKWPNNGIYRIVLHKESTAGLMRGVMTSLEESNAGFKFDWDKKENEKDLKDKKFGGVFAEEEYEKMDGSIGTTVKLKWFRSVKSIEDGNYEIPEKKKLARNENAFGDFQTTAGNDDDDLPF